MSFDKLTIHSEYDDNYFALMPNESKTIHISYHKEDGRGVKPNVVIEDFANSSLK